VPVRKLRAAILSGKAEAAVHSSKDPQPVSANGLCLTAVPPRGDPRDVLVGSALATCPRARPSQRGASVARPSSPLPGPA
jgi:hydroxymethylbilane synthase